MRYFVEYIQLEMFDIIFDFRILMQNVANANYRFDELGKLVV